MTCPGMEPATMQRPYQTGPSDTNDSFFYSTLLQQSMQKGKPTALNFGNPQIPAPKPPPQQSTSISKKSSCSHEQYESTWFCELSYLFYKVHHQTRPCEKEKQMKKNAIFLGSSKSVFVSAEMKQNNSRVPILEACIGNSSKHVEIPLHTAHTGRWKEFSHTDSETIKLMKQWQTFLTPGGNTV